MIFSNKIPCNKNPIMLLIALFIKESRVKMRLKGSAIFSLFHIENKGERALLVCFEVA